MVMDRSYILFCAALSELAGKKCNVGIGHEESEEFMKRIYSDYLLTSHPEPDVSWIKSPPSSVKAWMNEVINENFLCMSVKPKWVGEPSWRFVDGSPMVFISQVEFESNDVMDNKASSGDVLYIFSGRRNVEHGWELAVKMVKQDKKSVGTTYIN